MEGRICHIKSRWHSFAAVVMAASISGTPYAFGIFSEIFKLELGFDQVDLAIIGSCGSTGLYTGVLCGLSVERFGPGNTLRFGSALVFFGNIFIWLAVQKVVWHNVFVISIFFALAQVGIACVTATATIIAIRVFPSEVTGQAAGLAKGYFGVSSAVLATCSAVFFRETSVNFILFVALALPAVQLYASFNANFIPLHLVSFDNEKLLEQPQSLPFYIYHMLGIFFLIVAVGAIKHFHPVTGLLSVTAGCIVALYVGAVMILPSLNGPRDLATEVCESPSDARMCRRVDNEYYQANKSDALSGDNEDMFTEATGSIQLHEGSLTLIDEVAARSEGGDGGDETVVEDWTDGEGVDDMYLQRASFVSYYGRHVPLNETVCMWRCYGLMVVFMCVAGAGLLVINNIQAVAAAVKEKPSAFFVTVLSVANASGRVFVGVLADKYMEHVSRLQVIFVICVLMGCAQLVLSFGHPQALYPSLLLVGITFGAIFSSMAAVASDIFGSQYVGSNYGFIDLAPAFGSYIFSVGMVAAFYPSHDSDSPLEANAECVGADCFRCAFWITCICCLGSAGLSYYMHNVTPLRRKHVRV